VAVATAAAGSGADSVGSPGDLVDLAASTIAAIATSFTSISFTTKCLVNEDNHNSKKNQILHDGHSVKPKY